MARPSVKGSILQSAAADVLKLVEAGEISSDELEVSLSEEDRRILHETIQPSILYPIDTLNRLLVLLVEHRDGGSIEDFLRQRGWNAAERLAAHGLYQQLDNQGRLAGSTWAQMASAGRMAVTLCAVLYNFTRWSFEQSDEGVFQIDVEQATDFPETLRFASEGFIAYMAERATGLRVRVESTRVTFDHVVITIQRAES